ncbi:MULTISPECIES: ABC transporter ATP-binding protein [Xanthomonas]|uniref:ABC transporter ATP-binding protein n=1 Tax=Xanthomonas TaxID=338 RepID=UPI001237B265|nr:ABC transporter ATP-binding protein [Xanthomonas phaseoli]MBO9766857.1 ABC transporter ATP-binding protein [Xanthomonas phaseoli pv. dieffenbachiae]MBO9776634.1 ABC transporter ATP-binding protein [Xanthomonas phaseoli pv. dieffenbachiae]MBO9778581.1 ABC transporter ATP-binding protein [Xanthomonas phaseoli pv. dieffenbachiae]MBO9794695.1 ABC transporter ATP-binding protein [Xanthomonas phaseoli pv. dieffenbachiae]MBO9800513.1 ABC transporter ATP-binding protein [Xanthomonas phaseoli pv. di
MTHAISISDLHVAYRGRAVLQGLNLGVAPGTVYALLGGNGAGKSSTLSTLLGFVKPVCGSVRVDAVDPVADPANARARLAYLPENVALYEHLSALENADYLLALAGQRRSQAAIGEAFASAGLQRDAWAQRLAGFSKGMRQKVAIAVATLREVPVLLLDEPTSGLDPRAIADFNRLVGSVRARGAAVLMVTHDLLGAVEVADRIGFLENGRIAEEIGAGDSGFDVRTLHARFVRPQDRAA